MAVIAQWLSKTWEVSPEKIVALEGLATSYKLVTDNNNDAGGKSPTRVRGLDLQPLTFETFLSDTVGIDVRDEIESWGALVGETGPFILAGRRFGPEKIQLASVDASDIVIDDMGRFRQARLNMNFMEYAPEANKNKPKNSTTAVSSNKKAAGKKPAPGIASPAAYTELGVKGTSAVKVGPSTADKFFKKPANIQLAR